MKSVEPLAAITYRLFRLRRLWLVASGVPAFGVMLAVWAAGGDTVLESPTVLLAVGMIWSVAVGGLIARFPRASLEIMAISLATMIFAVGFPLIEEFIVVTPTPLNLVRFIVVGTLALMGWFVLYMIMAVVWPMASIYGPRLQLRSRTALHCDQTADAVFAYLRMLPNTENAFRRIGPIDADGFSDVFMYMPQPAGITTEPDPADDEVDDETQLPSYRLRIIENGQLWQTTMVATSEDPLQPAVGRLEVVPTRSGSTVISEEMHRHFTILMAFDHWLIDFGRDHFIAQIDVMAGRPARANRMQPIDSPMVWIARTFFANPYSHQT